MTKGRPAKSQALGNRRVILDRATILFADHGFDGVSIRDIAAASSIHVSTLYHYFPQKQEIYAAVVAEAMSHVSALFVDSLAGNQLPLLALTNFFDRILHIWESGSAHARIIDRLLLDGRLDLMPLSMFDQARSALRVLARGMMGRTPDEPTFSDFAEIVLGISYGVAKFRPMNHTYIHAGGPLSPPRHLAAFMAAWLMEGLQAAVADRSARQADPAPAQHAS